MNIIKAPEKIRALVKIKIIFFEEINSTQPNHRAKLRKTIFQIISREKADLNESLICDLNSIPKISGGGLSLSHSRKGSVFSYSLQPLSIGIDIEEINRLKPSLINRIAVIEEQRSCPNPRWLFSAKEAAWKALNQTHSMPTISHIETHSWDQKDSIWASYLVRLNGHNIDGYGFIRELSDTYLSFYLVPSTFS